MSAIETFYLLFKSDAGEAAQGVEKLEDAADKAEDAAKGVDKALKDTAKSANTAATATAKVSAETSKADANAKRLAGSFMSVVKALAAPVLAAFSITGLAGIATGRAAAIRELDQISVKLNSTIQDVDAFQRSVQGMGGTGAAALDSMVKMGEKVNEAFSDAESGAAKDFKAWGLAFKDTEGNALGAADAMLELAANIENLSQAEALARIKKLGIEDAATIELLLKGRAAVEENINAQKRLGVVTDEQAKATRDYYRELGTMNNTLTSFGNMIAGALLPGLTRGIQLFTRALGWMAENRRLVEGFFIGIATAVTVYFFPAMVKAAASVLALIAPFAAVVAAVALVGAAFALVYEDVRAFMDGQPSLIGELASRYEWFAEVVKGIGAAFKWLANEWEVFKRDIVALGAELVAVFDMLKTAASAVADFLGPVFTPLVDAFKNWGEAISGAVDAIREFFGTKSEIEGMKQPVVDLWEVIQKLGPAAQTAANIFRTVFGAAIQVIANGVNGVAAAIRAVVSAFQGMGNFASSFSFSPGGGESGIATPAEVRAGVPQGQQQLKNAAAANHVLAMGAVGKNSNGQTVNNNVNVGDINVTTNATDPAAVGREVRNQLKQTYSEASSQFDDGINR